MCTRRCPLSQTIILIGPLVQPQNPQHIRTPEQTSFGSKSVHGVNLSYTTVTTGSLSESRKPEFWWTGGSLETFSRGRETVNVGVLSAWIRQGCDSLTLV
eukprot:1182777-Prorocentrum_minimum.AAC.3